MATVKVKLKSGTNEFEAEGSPEEVNALLSKWWVPPKHPGGTHHETNRQTPPGQPSSGGDEPEDSGFDAMQLQTTSKKTLISKLLTRKLFLQEASHLIRLQWFYGAIIKQ